jgi:hypothetical protein
MAPKQPSILNAPIHLLVEPTPILDRNVARPLKDLEKIDVYGGNERDHIRFYARHAVASLSTRLILIFEREDLGSWFRAPCGALGHAFAGAIHRSRTALKAAPEAIN